MKFRRKLWLEALSVSYQQHREGEKIIALGVAGIEPSRHVKGEYTKD